MKEMNILCSTDRNFLYPTYVTFESVIANHPSIALHFYLFTGRDISEKEKADLLDFVRSQKCDLTFIDVDPALYAEYMICERFPVSAYYRLLAHELLPASVDRVLYLDVDILVNADLYDGFYNLDFCGKYLVATSHNPDPSFYNTLSDTTVNLEAAAKGEFFNSGVLLMNLDLFRKSGISIKDYTNAYRSCEKKGIRVFYDQGLLNYMFYNKTLYLSSMDYNYRFSIPKDYQNRLDPDREYKKAIIHFTGMKQPYKPWDIILSDEEIAAYGVVPYSNDYFYISPELNELSALWWAYAQKTPIYEKVLEEANIKTKWFKRNLMDFTLKHNAMVSNSKKNPTEKIVYKTKTGECQIENFHPRAYKLGCAIAKPYWALKKIFGRKK